jgi:Leucine rich repeat N-terminal domain
LFNESNGIFIMNVKNHASFAAAFRCLTAIFSCVCGLAQAIPLAERTVLLSLYSGTNGASWSSSTNWGGATGTECTWFGVTCSAGDTNVTELRLGSNNLVGTLPTTLNQLTALQVFEAFGNQLSGTIPSLTGLTALRNFEVNFNQLTGSIPALTGIASLERFIVSGNQLSGSIPSLVGLVAMSAFVVENNQLTGSIPSLSAMTALRFFDVDGNQLTGGLPSLSGLTQLVSFEATNNQFSGGLPGLSDQTLLWRFRVSGNQLTGPIPAPPASLLAGQSSLCPNPLAIGINAAWDAATGSTPWSAACAPPAVANTPVPTIPQWLAILMVLLFAGTAAHRVRASRR